MDRALRVVLSVIGLAALPCGTARASEWTDVMSSADDRDPFDGMLSVRYGWQLEKSQVTREFVCNNVTGLCPGEHRTVLLKEIDAGRTLHTLDIDGRIGLYHDLELFFTLPIVLSDVTSLSFAAGVGGTNSTVAPDNGPHLFDLPNDGPKRAGFGDMTLGLRYAPLAQWRDPQHPTIRLGVSWTLPTGTPRKGGNTGVGTGYHVLKFETTASRRIAFVEPYFGFFGDLRLPGWNTLFKNHGPTQNHVWPGPDLGILAGIEFFPWDKPRPDGKKGRYFSIDVGFSARYTFQGRDYTVLSDAFARSSCNDDPTCTLTTYSRTLENDPTPSVLKMDGVTDVGPYGTFGLWTGLNLQPIENLQLGFRFSYARQTAHYLTFANVGSDLDGNLPTGSAGVDHQNTLGQNEFNPVYNGNVDDPGRRFRSEGTNIFGILLTISGKL